jgi:anti-sigma B factor antagonist
MSDWIKVDAQPSGVTVVSPEGDIDMSRTPELRTVIQGVFQGASPNRLVFDLGDVGYMDSSGLATLVEAMRRSKTGGATMILCGLNERVRAIFEIARLDQFFKIVLTRDDALNA